MSDGPFRHHTFHQVAKACANGQNPSSIEINPQMVLLSQQEQRKVLFDLMNM